MPLLDHFRPPLAEKIPWTGFHSRWATAIADRLNERWLPPRFRAIANIQLGGGMIEIDAATLRESGWKEPVEMDTAGWTVPKPGGTAVVDFAGLDTFEVKVLYDSGGYHLIAAVELVSPANKDRPSTRRAFATKCANYLEEGISLLIVDVVTERHANLHRELSQLLKLEDENWQPASGLYSVAYHPVQSEQKTRIDWWPEPLSIGENLPRMPLWIGSDVSVPVELEETYLTTFERLRLPRPELNGQPSD